MLRVCKKKKKGVGGRHDLDLATGNRALREQWWEVRTYRGTIKAKRGLMRIRNRRPNKLINQLHIALKILSTVQPTKEASQEKYCIYHPRDTKNRLPL